ncbi:hypothetical protein ACS0TY_029047 [Phlomoides rotata]
MSTSVEVSVLGRLISMCNPLTYNLGFNLFAYFEGNNTEHVKIKMTTPVLVDIRNSTYTVYFLLPKEYRSNITSPLSTEIEPVILPKHKFAAVRRFGGFLTEDDIRKNFDALKKSLQGTPYQKADDLNYPLLRATTIRLNSSIGHLVLNFGPLSINFAVRRYGGFLTDDDVRFFFDSLKKSLQGTSYQKAVDLNLSTVAGYDDPFTPFNRVNEVFLWFD